MDTIFLVLAIIIFVLIDVCILVWIMKHKKKLCDTDKQKILQILLKTESLSEYEQILELDKLLDFVLKNLGTKGNTLGERMKNAGKLFKNEKNIWFAHKLRNQIAHEVGVSMNKKDFEKAKQAFLVEIKNWM